MITIGADPEVFLRNSETKELIPACGLIGGSKDKPLSLGRKGYYVQEDNVMLEFNIPPARDADDFLKHIESGLAFVGEHLGKVLPSAEFEPKAEHLWSEDKLDSEGARTFGCSPDFDAYTQGARCAPITPQLLKRGASELRFAGGHVHLGYENKENVPDFVVSAMCDLLIGLKFVEVDRQPERRKLYGQAGRYRPTKYGIEYRTLSNFWIQDRELCHIVGSCAYQVGWMIESVPMTTLQAFYREMPWPNVRAAINSEDADLAASLLSFAASEMRSRKIGVSL